MEKVGDNYNRDLKSEIRQETSEYNNYSSTIPTNSTIFSKRIMIYSAVLLIFILFLINNVKAFNQTRERKSISFK